MEERVSYYQALQVYDDTQNANDFLRLLVTLVEKSLSFYLSLYE